MARNVFMPAPELPEWLDQMLPFKRYLVDTGAWRMHVMENGSGIPIIMVHGNPTWGFLWRKVARALGQQYRSIMPDLVGLGMSDKPQIKGFHTIENHADALSRLLDLLELEKFVLVVQDWGGPIGALAASQHADKLVGLVVLNTILGPPKPGFRPTAFHRFSAMPVISDLAYRLFDFPQAFLGGAQGDKRSISGNVERAYTWPIRTLRTNKAPLALSRMVPDSLTHRSVPALTDVQDFIGSYSGPAAIVWGDKDPVLGRAFGRIERALPQARVWRTNAGHFLQEEVSDVIAEAIRWTVRAAEEQAAAGARKK